MRWRQGLMLSAGLLALTWTGCADGSRRCTAGADCASGVCNDDGTCGAPLDDARDAGADHDAGEHGEDDAASGDGGLDADNDGGDEPDLSDDGACRPNQDGLITAAEVPLAVGQRGNFRVARDVRFDTEGQQVDGQRRWDLSGDFQGDQTVIAELRPLDGQWFEDAFPDATYFTRLNLSAELLGVFQITDDALLLLGVVSPDPGLTQTELTYDPPVTVLQFPLSADAAWTTEAEVSGLSLGVFTFYTETYTSVVDAQGQLTTPFSTFDVMRVQVLLERTIGLLTTQLRTFAFVTECFGTVANVTSQDNEEGTEFTEVSELRRLTP